MYTSNNLTANQSAIASKLGSYSLIRGHQGNTHRLSWRYREQARSCSLIRVHQGDMGWLSGRHREQAQLPQHRGHS